MRKVIVDFVAHRSVVVNLNDDDEDDRAIAIAENYVEGNRESVTWEYENCEDTDDEGAINNDDILTCEVCGESFVDLDDTGCCPVCGYVNYK